GLDPATYQLGSIRPHVQADGENTGEELLQRDAEEGQDEEYPEELHEQRGSAEELNIDRCGTTNDSVVGKLHQPGGCSHDNGEYRGQECLLNGDKRAGDVVRPILGQKREIGNGISPSRPLGGRYQALKLCHKPWRREDRRGARMRSHGSPG